ncbi:hypothetical protein [Sebaldella sp. S0638]|uniref:hypothetical protein n=1 Tax=Sebaldella sp. S0638 TaxID=2957809 RepID=UPI0020A13185|nr:hypothetical protein [Sebaldella sp. S0638]MCP1224252.1 hypothetical protein [Sebaldella sp. S0638]
MKLYNKEKIIKQMISHYNKNKTITMKSFNEDKNVCCSTTVKRYFDTWNNAKIEAGFTSGIEYNRDKLIKLIKEKIKTKEIRRISDIDRIEGLPSYKYIKKLWTKEEMEEIFKVKIKRYTYTAENISEQYNCIKEKYEKVTFKLLKKETGISAGTIRKYFKSWNKFLEYMGEKPNHVITSVIHSNEELIELYRKMSIKIGKEIYGATSRDLKEYNFPYSKSVLASRFTSLNHLRKLAGFEIKREIIPKYSRQGLKLMLYTNYKKYGRKLTQTEIAENDSLPNPSSIFYHFQTTKISDVWKEVLNEK